MEFTTHAYFRYAQRVKGEALLNQASYNALEKSETEKCNGYRKEVEDIFDKSEFIISGAFDSKNTMSDFYLNKDSKIVFVCNAEQKKVLTCYLVDFGFGDVVNSATMNALLKEIDKKKSEKDKFINKNSKDLDLKEQSVKSLEFDIKMLEDKVKLLNTQKAIIEAEIDVYKDTVDLYDKEITSRANALCHSIGFKVKEEFI